MSKRVFYVVVLISLSAGLLFSEAPITIDNSYLDWQKLPASATFSQSYDPVFFSREMGGQVQRLRIEESVYWKKGGTLITEFKSFMDETNLYLYLEVSSPFADETSVYCYPYSQRESKKANFFTIELVPERRDRIGGVLLWESGRVLPEIIGKLRSTSLKLECLIPITDLPKSFVAGDIETLSFDLTTTYHEPASGMYEEFFITTLYFKDISRQEDLSGE
jgi:hypothetical protein